MPYILPSTVFWILGRENDIRRLEHRIARWIMDSPSEIRPMLRHQFNGMTKCFRPLTIFACHYAQTNDDAPENLIILAHVIEIIHNITLIIDDIVDDSDTRRGKPTLHDKYDEMTAYMVASFLFAEAYKILSTQVADEFYASRPKYLSSDTTPTYRQDVSPIPDTSEIDANQVSSLDKEGLLTPQLQDALLYDDEVILSGEPPTIHAIRTDMRLISELLERLAIAEVAQWDSRKDGTQPQTVGGSLRTDMNLGLKDWRFLAREDTGCMFEICACIGARSQRFRRIGRLIGMLYHASDDIADLVDAKPLAPDGHARVDQSQSAGHLSGGGDQDIKDGILTLPAALAIQSSNEIRATYQVSNLDVANYNTLLFAFKDQVTARVGEIAPAMKEFDGIKSQAEEEVATLTLPNSQPLFDLIEQVALLAPR